PPRSHSRAGAHACLLRLLCPFFLYIAPRPPRSTPFPTRRSSDLDQPHAAGGGMEEHVVARLQPLDGAHLVEQVLHGQALEHHGRSEEHTSELQSPDHLVCRLLLEKKKVSQISYNIIIAT